MNTIESLVKLDERQLLHELGQQLAAFTFGSGDLRPEDVGRSWFTSQIEYLQTKICNSNVVNLYRLNPGKWDNVMLVAAISDLLAGAVTGVSPVTVAALIVKKGIEKCCPNVSE